MDKSTLGDIGKGLALFLSSGADFFGGRLMDKSKLLLAKILDKVKQYKKCGEAVFTSFLDPAEQYDAQTVLRDIPYFCWGGYDDAERKIIIIGADELIEDIPICLVHITSNEQLAHRSVLGSILGLGISRDKVGDILVDENECDVLLQNEIAGYVLNNLSYVGREKVKVTELELDEIHIPAKKEKEFFTTVASLRIDAVISSSLGISREKSSELIEGEKVNLNYKQVNSNRKQVTERRLDFGKRIW